MRRRRLSLQYSDDEEEEEQNQSNSSNPNTTTTQRRNLSISDDDFVDVPQHLSPPLPPISNQNSQLSSSINELLQIRGLKLRSEWLNSCIQSLQTSIPGFSNLDLTGKSELCFAQYLFSDMNISGTGILPPNIHNMHLVDLPGPFVLQVDEIVNVSAPLKVRYHDASAGIKRCLKLSMTDGVQRVFGMEYRPIPALTVLAPAGFKVCIHNVHVLRGLLLLVPEVVDVLGGVVEDLDAARQRLVKEINKPPRGKRTQTGSTPSLSSRATRAAWPTDDDVNDHRHTENVTPRHRVPAGMSDQGATSNADTRGSTREADNVPNGRASAEHSRPSNSSVVLDGTNTNNARIPNHGNNRERDSEVFAEPSVSNLPRNAASAIRDTGARGRLGSISSNSSVNLRRSITEDLSISMSRSTAEANPSSITVNLEEINMVGVSRHNYGEERRTIADPEPNPFLDAALDDRDTDMGEGSDDTIGANIQARIVEPSCVPRPSSFTEPNPSSNVAANLEEIDMIDASMPLHGNDPASNNRDTDMTYEVHPLILAGDGETPFTYLASLFAKLSENAEEDTSDVQGKIKCFLTGVKEFLFKGRATYELHVYIDDGSLISEILIDHNVVEDAIGHSPYEVCAGLASPDKSISSRMRDTMRRFQIYLVNFEGILVVEMKGIDHPLVAVEMKQGCSSSDALSLLRRVKRTLPSPQTPRRQPRLPVEPIDISP